MNDSEVKRDLERLKRDCEEAERFANHEWREGILDLLRYVENASPEERRSEEFNRLIWSRKNPIASMPQGELSHNELDQVVGSDELLSWLANMEPLPDNPERRAEVLDSRLSEAVDLVKHLTGGGKRRPAAVTRLLAALFPRDFTSLIASRLLDEFISYFNKRYPTLGIDPKVSDKVSDPEKHRQILKRLDDALGTVPERDLEERVRRMTLPHQLHELWSEEPRPKLQPADDSGEETTPQNIILYGPPGTGKTYTTFQRCVEICDGEENAENMSDEEVRRRYGELVAGERVEFVTFHQSYGYEEFVEGLRPGEDSTGVGFRLVPTDGVLKRIAEHAKRERDLPHVLVIDEINRANISKVMGELVTLLEEDKLEGAPHEIAVTLPHSGKSFTLPKNLYILGTMNTADRSIALIDTALRRRFHFEELPPNPDLLSDDVEGIDLPTVLRTINDRLEWLIDRDHLIGHAWLMGAQTKADVDRVMRRKIIPLIAEYFYDDWEKVHAVLGNTDDFVKGEPLSPPPGIDDVGETRYRWKVQEKFEEGAYERLISGSGQTDAE